MEKQKKWQRYLILTVIILTIYNILPTVFFYTKPLSSPIDEKRAEGIAAAIVSRVNALEDESVGWLYSFCHLLKLKPLHIELQPQDPEYVSLTFKSVEDANLFRQHLPRAGSLIPFVPAQVTLQSGEEQSKNVVVQRRIPVHFNEEKLQDYFQFSQKFDAQNQPTPLYRALVEDRALEVGISLAGPSENAMYVKGIIDEAGGPQTPELLIHLAQNILSFAKTFGENSEISHRYFSSFSQIEVSDKSAFIQSFVRSLGSMQDQVKAEVAALKTEEEQLKAKGQFLEPAKQQRIELLTSREKTLTQASAIVKRNSAFFAKGQPPLNFASLGALMQEGARTSKLQTISLGQRNPFISALAIDWSNEKIYLLPHADVVAYRQNPQVKSYDQADQLLYNEIALASRQSGERISPFQDRFEIELSQLTNSQSFLAMRLSTIAQAEAKELKETLGSAWHPSHPDLKSANFPIYDYDTFINLPAEEQKLGLVIYAPASYKRIPPAGFKMNSLYVVAKGMDKILARLQGEPQNAQTAQFMQDFNHLRDLLNAHGFVGYSGKSIGLGAEFASDFIFEVEDYYQTVLKATREEFGVHGTKRYAVLEFTNVEQRILTENKIGNHIHEDLLKWRDDYLAAQLGIRGVSKFDVPKPVHNVYWSNFQLSLAKYFRGDDRKILHWGLDLSGGKTVQIELRDSNNRMVTNEADIQQGINELYNRVNKMGVSEVSIRKEGNYITLDFPGSQGLSATELVKASSMYFNIVNEKFGSNNEALAAVTNRFLQEVWNEAVVTGKKEIDEINQIAWKHLYGDSLDPDVIQPRSEAGRTLYENGFRLGNPLETAISSAMNEAYSKIAIYRGDDFTDWYGQTHPLLVVFRNFALEGSNLENIQAAYDPSKGNFLSFSVKGSYSNKEGQRLSPREELFAWTSHFAREKIAGTPLEAISGGKGWRMAVILNGSVISAPTLDAALRDSAMISGSFTQREVGQLEADLKAGSLSFTPRILSEKNVSPELGAKERTRGIVSTIASLVLVIGVLLGYYRFCGVVASIAVLFNLLILWATLQNLQATMTLAGIAGIILTLGMAVDANVLVFERIREEFSHSGRIASAVHAGYRKAFSAILDSNVTTIIAALILLHFDSGPIKAFAITLIIGILSSMFTALFMTRFFFAGWVQNPEHKAFKMLNWFKAQKFDFLKHTKITLILTSVVILIGGGFFLAERSTLFGMDFKGGYALNVEIQPTAQGHYRAAVEAALIKQGIHAQEIQIRELTPANNVRILLSRGLEQQGRPFYGLPMEYDLKEPAYPYLTNPKIVWVVQSLQKAGLQVSPDALEELNKNWTEVSGQISDSMRNNALIGLAIALLSILVYITLRFEFKYAASATLCLAHDVIFTIGVIAILHYFGVPIQIDLNTVAALMTMVGYSLNDTIIVFDRIREDVRLMRKSSFSEIINHALNVTLSRTMLTSGTTLLVLLPLILFGGSTLFGFSLVMAIGVIFGTLSSLFIATPLLKYFHDRELRKEQKILASER